MSPELLDVLGAFEVWQARTHGAVSAAFATGGNGHWSLERAAGTATHLTGAPLMLNSLTKSYVLNRAADAALRHCGGVVVNIGGDVVVKGRTEAVVDVANPLDDTENSAPVAPRVLFA